METFDVVVVGVGTMGAAACAELALRGARVCGVEQFSIPHGRGAHHGHSRVIRTAYFEAPDYVPLAQQAWTAWRELEDCCGGSILFPCGLVTIAETGATAVSNTMRAARTHQLAIEQLTQSQLEARYPQFRHSSSVTATFESQAGYLVPERGVAALAQRALNSGALLRGHEEVHSIEREGGRYRVTTARGILTADTVVITAGAWAERFLRGLCQLRIERQIWAWFWPAEPRAFAEGWPVWFYEDRQNRGYYGFPMTLDSLGFKVGIHGRGAVKLPANMTSNASRADTADHESFVATHIPQAKGPLLAARACHYANSPDGDFIVGPLPDEPNVIVAAGFSGHGYKFSPVIGSALADFALNGKTELPLDFLSPRRFA